MPLNFIKDDFAALEHTYERLLDYCYGQSRISEYDPGIAMSGTEQSLCDMGYTEEASTASLVEFATIMIGVSIARKAAKAELSQWVEGADPPE